jgi:hypothetical protein
VDPWIIILAAWLPIAGIVLALCLYDMTSDKAEPVLSRPPRPGVNPDPADES